MNENAHITKVAVLGGGVGGMTAAFELTATPELRERFDVTVYQLGWRVGGKGASGRNRERADRIEEHGLHVWFGFYDNAFRLMRDAYEELGREPGTPLATLGDAFDPCDQLVLYDRQGAGWHAHELDFPRNLLRPGEAGALPTFWEMAAVACGWALSGWRSLKDDRELDLSEPDFPFVPDWFEDLAADVAGDLLSLPLEGAERLLALAERLAGLRAGQTNNLVARQAAQPALLVKLLKGFRDWLWLVLRGPIEDDAELRLFFTFVDAGVSTLAGIVEDGVLEQGFDAVNDEEWSAWLARHGAKEVTLGRTPEQRAPVLRSVYDVAFGFPGGAIGAADVAAGVATNDLLRLVFSYRGSIMQKMQAGMGDVVFTPLYEVLRRRGVRFKFFHEVTRLGVAGDTKRVDTIDVVPQAELRDEAQEYLPLADVKGLGCWPSEPLWDQLEPRARGHDFELQANPLRREPLRLRRGEDFDTVVLGIPVGALAPICAELMERDERFRSGIERAVTVRTQAFQVWANRSSEELGWTHAGNSVAGCYVEPIDTYCDMTHLIPRESWDQGDEVRTIGYLCGVLEDRPGETQDQATERVRRNAVEFMERDMATLWPAALRPDGSFDWSVLVDREERTGPGRFEAQYWRANVAPSERYVLTPAGSVEHRLPSDDSGFENLMLAGDWTRNGIDGGCVEAAVISGIEAAAGLIGDERPAIPGRGGGWLRPRPLEQPPYVEFGGRATAPPPFLCARGRLRSLLLRGDEDRIGALVQRMFNAPAGDAIEYRPVSSDVLLLVGEFGRVTSLTPPFDRWGAVRETQASFWFPVLAGHQARRLLRGRAPGAGRAVHLRRQPDVLPRRARGLRLRQDDGALHAGRRAGRARSDRGLRRQLRPQRGRRLVSLPGDHRDRRRRVRPPRRRAAGGPGGLPAPADGRATEPAQRWGAGPRRHPPDGGPRGRHGGRPGGPGVPQAVPGRRRRHPGVLPVGGRGPGLASASAQRAGAARGRADDPSTRQPSDRPGAGPNEPARRTGHGRGDRHGRGGRRRGGPPGDGRGLARRRAASGGAA